MSAESIARDQLSMLIATLLHREGWESLTGYLSVDWDSSDEASDLKDFAQWIATGATSRDGGFLSECSGLTAGTIHHLAAHGRWRRLAEPHLVCAILMRILAYSASERLFMAKAIPSTVALVAERMIPDSSVSIIVSSLRAIGLAHDDVRDECVSAAVRLEAQSAVG